VPLGPANIECILIADDLTGACDAGVHFARCGLVCRVDLSFASPRFSRAPDVLAFSTNSRGDGPEEFHRKIKTLASGYSGLKSSLLFKKVDSTLRGNVGAEIAAVLGAFRCDVAMIAPAFPAMRRHVRGGNLHWSDYSGKGQINIAQALIEQGVASGKIAHMSPTVEDFQKAFEEHLDAGKQFFILDCDSQNELHFWAAAAGAVSRRILWVGSAGLGIALAEHTATAGVRRFISKRIGIPLIFVMGSTHPASLRQKTALLAAGNAVEVMPSASAIASARQALREKRHLVVSVERGADQVALREFLNGLEGLDMAALFFTGGDTGMRVCNAIGARAIDLRDEILPGFPWGFLRGGVFHGLPVASKSGSFGGEDALLCCADFFAPTASRRLRNESRLS
jgi:D-threonate/D-erythronate kinase